MKAIKKISSLKVTSSVKSKGKTGVEMEALNAVSIACLTIYDMCKSIDKKILLKTFVLLKKVVVNQICSKFELNNLSNFFTENQP